MQKFLTEYANLLEPLANLENYYGEPAITSAIANTKLAIQTCKVYKNTILESDDEEIQENQENNEAQKEAEKTDKEASSKRSATIGRISS